VLYLPITHRSPAIEESGGESHCVSPLPHAKCARGHPIDAVRVDEKLRQLELTAGAKKYSPGSAGIWRSQLHRACAKRPRSRPYEVIPNPKDLHPIFERLR
jgi:hypothetical protein